MQWSSLLPQASWWWQCGEDRGKWQMMQMDDSKDRQSVYRGGETDILWWMLMKARKADTKQMWAGSYTVYIISLLDRQGPTTTQEGSKGAIAAVNVRRIQLFRHALYRLAASLCTEYRLAAFKSSSVCDFTRGRASASSSGRQGEQSYRLLSERNECFLLMLQQFTLRYVMWMSRV